jgi:hypothetical protein
MPRLSPALLRSQKSLSFLGAHVRKHALLRRAREIGAHLKKFPRGGAEKRDG